MFLHNFKHVCGAVPSETRSDTLAVFFAHLICSCLVRGKVIIGGFAFAAVLLLCGMVLVFTNNSGKSHFTIAGNEFDSGNAGLAGMAMGLILVITMVGIVLRTREQTPVQNKGKSKSSLKTEDEILHNARTLNSFTQETLRVVIDHAGGTARDFAKHLLRDGVSFYSLEMYLEHLEHNGMIKSKQDGARVRYWPTDLILKAIKQKKLKIPKLVVAQTTRTGDRRRMPRDSKPSDDDLGSGPIIPAG